MRAKIQLIGNIVKAPYKLKPIDRLSDQSAGSCTSNETHGIMKRTLWWLGKVYMLSSGRYGYPRGGLPNSYAAGWLPGRVLEDMALWRLSTVMVASIPSRTLARSSMSCNSCRTLFSGLPCVRIQSSPTLRISESRVEQA